MADIQTVADRLEVAVVKAENAADTLDLLVEGNSTATVLTDGGKILPSIDKWYTDNFATLTTSLNAQVVVATTKASEASVSAAAALVSETAAALSETNAGNSETAAALSETNALASKNAAALSETNAGNSETAAASSETSSQEWAIHPENVLVPSGNTIDEYSALHHRNKSDDSATAAALSETNAGNSETAAALSETNAGNSETAAALSETNAGNSETAAALSETNALASKNAAALSETNASTSATTAEEWAIHPENVLVPSGNTIDEYSALHHRNKAEIAQAAAEAAEAALAGGIAFSGSHSAAVGTYPAAPAEGSEIFRISVGGTLGGQVMDVGDFIIYDRPNTTWRNVKVADNLRESSFAVSLGSTLHVTGNITTNGTVDGRDVAADGTKLDTIETSANNYTHPAHTARDASFDTGALTGAVVISDINFDLITDTSGHVTAGLSSFSTRTLTAANIGALAVGAKAADSNLLDGIDSLGFARLGTLAPTSNYLYTTRSSASSAMYVRQGSTGDLARFFQSPTASATSGASFVTFSNNGSITLSGTVDGRDVAADGTKLDGIATSANNYVHPTYNTTNINTSGATIVDIITTTNEGHISAMSTRVLTLANLGYTGATDANNYVHPSNAATNQALSGANVVSTITTDATGHVTALANRALTPANIGALAVAAKAADSELLDGVNGASYARSDATDTISGHWDFTNTTYGIGTTMGIDGRYAIVGGSAAFGGTIYGMGQSYNGAGAGATWLPTSLYGLAWIRASHANANANVGEGLYIYQGGAYQGGIGTSGIDTNGNITVSGTVDGRDVAADGTKLDGIATSANNYSLPLATSTVRGGVELYSNTDNPTAANAVTSTASRTYGIQLNSSNQMVVNVPWTDANTVYTHPSYASTNINTSGATIVDIITTNTTGHVTALGTRTLTAANIGALAVGAKAADSNLLDGIDSLAFLRSNTSDQFTSGTLTFNDNTYIGFGTSNGEGTIRSNGTSIYWDLGADKDIYIRDLTTSRFLFDSSLGDFHADGNVYGYSVSVGSDPKLKNTIEPITSGLDKLMQLNGVTFFWNKSGEDDAGLLSPDVKKILPQAVKDLPMLGTEDETIENAETYESVNYNAVMGVIVEGVKELKNEKDIEIHNLKTEVRDLKNEMAKLKKMLQNLVGNN